MFLKINGPYKLGSMNKVVEGEILVWEWWGEGFHETYGGVCMENYAFGKTMDPTCPVPTGQTGGGGIYKPNQTCVNR